METHVRDEPNKSWGRMKRKVLGRIKRKGILTVIVNDSLMAEVTKKIREKKIGKIHILFGKGKSLAIILIA